MRSGVANPDGCSPSLSVDATAVDGAGGRFELRILNATDTASLNLTFHSEQTVGAGVFEVPPGDFKFLARAYGGPEAGFGKSSLQTCTGGGAVIEVDLTMETVPTRELSGTWAPTSTDVELAVYADMPLDDADFGWWEQDIAHTSSGNPVGWSLTVADDIGTGPLGIEACQSRTDQEACRGRVDIDEDGTIDLGDLVEPVSPTATIGDVLTVSLPVTIEQGRMTVRMDDITDPFNTQTVWRGIAVGNQISIPVGWFADGLSGTDYGLRFFAIDGAVIDWASSPEPVEFLDGYAYQAPGYLEI
jgi:hypothetical protein